MILGAGIVGVGERVGEGVVVGDGERVGVGVAEGVGLAEGSVVGVGETDGEGDGLVSAGSREEREFCGCGVLLLTKSEELLSVSSPFPPNSSTPPGPIDVASEDEFAFLSTLELAVGAIRDVPSPKVVPGVPKVTASTTVPEASDPLIKAKLLLFAIVPLPLPSQVKLEERLVLHQRKNP